MDAIQALHGFNLRCERMQKTIFANLSFQLQSGEILLIEGENGAGKSSLLRLITALSSPAQGDIHWQNQSIYTLGSLYSKQLHYIGHANGIKLGLTVKENLLLASHLTDFNSFTDSKALLNTLQLEYHLHTPATYLSAGQKRKVALARLFLFRKPLWILDEPLTALDINTQTLFLTQLNLHVQQGGMCILSSHQPIALDHAAVKTLRLSSC